MDLQSEYFTSYKELVKLSYEMRDIHGYFNTQLTHVQILEDIINRNLDNNKIKPIIDRYLLAKDNLIRNRKRHYLCCHSS